MPGAAETVVPDTELVELVLVELVLEALELELVLPLAAAAFSDPVARPTPDSLSKTADPVACAAVVWAAVVWAAVVWAAELPGAKPSPLPSVASDCAVAAELSVVRLVRVLEFIPPVPVASFCPDVPVAALLLGVEVVGAAQIGNSSPPSLDRMALASSRPDAGIPDRT